MIKTLHIWTLLACILAFSACRLDSFMFNPDTSITEYKLDGYEGESDFKLDSSYTIPDSLIHYRILESVDEKGTVAKIHSFYIGALNKISTDTVILYCHGNATHMDDYWVRAKLLANLGHKNRFGVMFFDYQGYGLSEGTPSEQNIYNDATTCLQWLKNQGLKGDRTILYGFSLGSAPATELTTNATVLTPHKLILEAPFASMDALSQNISRVSMASSFYSDLALDNASKVRNMTQPLLWIHGTKDSYVGINQGEIIASSYGGPYIDIQRIKDAEHSSVPNTMGAEAYLAMVLNFVK